MKSLLKCTFCLLFLLFAEVGLMAQESPNVISYKVTYDFITQRYTVWIVPAYSVPNEFNTALTERGATAQVTLAVPKDFVIADISGIRGVWDKQPLKLGPGQPNQDWSNTGLDLNTNYYVIGKAFGDTIYGEFKPRQEFALFSFSGNACLGPVRIIEPNEPFIAIADELYSFNVGNSFYSQSGQKPRNSQLEQFGGVAGPAASCSRVLTATPDYDTTPLNTAVTIPVLDNDTKDGIDITIADVILTILTFPTKGTLTLNADGTTTYTPNVGISGTDTFTYQICDNEQPTTCSETIVAVTVGTPNNVADVGISKMVNSSEVDLNDEVTFTIELTNNGPITATNIRIKDELPAGLEYISGADSFEGRFYFWMIENLAPGESRTLTLIARVVVQGISTNVVSVVSADQTDPDFTNNRSEACVSVPVVLCQGESLELSAPANFSNVEWYKDGVPFGSGNTITVTESGGYINTAMVGNCPAISCCPVVVVSEVCCNENICVPFVIEKVK